MQAVSTITEPIPGTVYHKPDGKEHPLRRKPAKKDYGTKRLGNSFLKTVFTPKAPTVVTRDRNGEEHNYVTKDNYGYLLASALRYASLMGINIKHNPGSSIGEGISNIYDELDAIIGDINLNIEPNGDKLQFVLWKYHPWNDYTFYWLPVKFTESLNPALKKIAVSFINQFMHSNQMLTTNDSFDVEWILDWATGEVAECDPCDKKSHSKP